MTGNERQDYAAVPIGNRRSHRHPKHRPIENEEPCRPDTTSNAEGEHENADPYVVDENFRGELRLFSDAQSNIARAGTSLKPPTEKEVRPLRSVDRPEGNGDGRTNHESPCCGEESRPLGHQTPVCARSKFSKAG